MTTTTTTTTTGIGDEVAETVTLTADVVLLAPSPTGPRVLLIRRGWAPHRGAWALPGGKVDARETTLAAAARELTEETGLHVGAARLRLVGLYDDPDRDPRGRYVSAAWAATLDTAPVPTAADDAADAAWVPATDITTGRVELAFDHARIVCDALDCLEGR